MTIALRLLDAGHEVVLVDPQLPGMGASFGNAGTIADYAVQPVGTPDVLKNLPALLFDKSSPLSIRRAALPTLAPWLMRFARQSLPGAARRNAAAIAALVQGAGPRWRELAAHLQAAELLQDKGCLYMYETARGFQAAGADMAFRRGLGVSVELINPQELSRMEPALPKVEGGAAWFPQASFLSDPGAMVQALARVVLRRAGLVQAAAHSITRQLDGVVVSGPGLRLLARKVILAAGAHSRPLAQTAGDRIPLETERGYHAEWDMALPRLHRPVCATRGGFYLCPMTGRLRVAGTVELGGTQAPASAHRIETLVRGGQAIFPDLGPPNRTWLGFRPSLPDSLPVIGPSAAGPEVIHAFGHGHIGLTLAPVTAEIVAKLVAGQSPGLDISPYRPNRF